MGSVTSMQGFLEERKGKVARADENFLRDEFSVAAAFLYTIDLAALLAPVEKWEAGSIPNLSDPIGRANFAVEQAANIARRMKRVCGLSDASAIELEAARCIEKAANNIHEELRWGSSVPTMRREWERSISRLVEDLAEFMIPVLAASNRSGVPDLRNG